MALPFKVILNRVRYGRRVRYGDFAPWEMEEDDPGQEEFKMSPEEENKYLKSLPLEKRDSEYFLHDYLPQKFGLSRDQTINMASRYIDHKKMHHGYRKYLSEDLFYDIPEMPSMHDTVNKLRTDGFDNSNIIACIGGFLDKNKHSEDLYNHLTNDARLYKITGKI